MNPSSPDILIVDDETQVRDILKVLLTSNGYSEIREAASGKEALDLVSKKTPSIIILDLGLPDMDGTVVLQEIKKKFDVPVLILSVRNQEDDKVKAFDLGADDYLSKPFGPRELLARIKILFRKNEKGRKSSANLKFGQLEIDSEKRIVMLNQKQVKLTDIEYKLLLLMAQHPGKLFTHREILKEVWGGNYVEHVEYLRVYIGHLRHKIEVDSSQPQFIITEPGIGYRFSVEPT